MFTDGETGLLLAKWLASLGANFLLPALKFKLKYLSLHLSGWMKILTLVILLIYIFSQRILRFFAQCCPDTD